MERSFIMIKPDGDGWATPRGPACVACAAAGTAQGAS